MVGRNTAPERPDGSVEPIPTWEFRRQAIVSIQALLRVVRAAMGAFGDDIQGIVILLAVASASVDASLRDAELTLNPPIGAMPLRHYRAVSRRAIAASTGLPRETVRRKIAMLIDQGLLVADGSRVRIPPGLLDEPRINEFAQTLLQEFIRTGERLERMSSPGEPDGDE
jgi:hypothetical protein